MRRLNKLIGGIGLIPLLLSGCAQIFDGNLFQGIDSPAPVSSAVLSSASNLESALAADSETLYAQLAANPSQLATAQATLETAFSATATTTAEKEAVVSAAQTYVLITANATDAADVVNSLVGQISTLQSGSTSDISEVLQELFASTDDVEGLLSTFVDIASALSAMQTASASGGTVDSDLFFGDSTNTGDIAQIALVAAAVDALASDYGGDLEQLASDLAAGTVDTSGSSLSELSDALSGDDQTTNDYAYIATVMSELGL